MRLTVETALSYDFPAPADLLLQVEAAHTAEQSVEGALWTTPVEDFSRIDGDASVGRRAWMRADGRLDVTYRATVGIDRADADLAALPASAPRHLDAQATSFLMPSRYCPSHEFEAFVATEFPGLGGGAMVAALSDWIGTKFTYVAGVSTGATTAQDSFVQRQGVCRDYAHVLIALTRAAGIPARMASVYAPDVDPPDFHAVVEARLDDAWHLIDPTGMAKPSDMAVIGVGRDAADVSFLTIMGAATLVSQSVTVARA